MSPVLMMYLLARSDDKNRIAQAANLCFLLGKLCQLSVLYPQLLQLPRADIGLLAAVSALSLLFVWLGIKLHRRFSYTVFRRLSLSILAALAVMMLYKGIAA